MPDISLEYTNIDCVQSLFKDNELEAYVILAQLCHDGWLPLQQLLPAKSVRAWFREYEPQAALHPAEALQVLSAKIDQQGLPSGDMSPSATCQHQLFIACMLSL